MKRIPIDPAPESAAERVRFEPRWVETRPEAMTVRSHPWWGLLWCEWFSHGKLLLGFLAIWLGAVWVLPLLASPGWIVVIGLAYAMLAGPAYGGGDVLEACEEFSFALPPTRGERYLARLIVGGGGLLVFTGMDLLALGLDLSQALARFYLDTGLVRPVQATSIGPIYGLVLAFPVAVFSGAFVLSAVTQSRTVVLTAWFWSLMAALIVLWAAVEYENLVFGRVTGLVANALLLGSSGAVLWHGYRVYLRKEVGGSARPIQLPDRWWLWSLVFLGGMLAAAILVAALARRLPELLPIFR
jgi:hypothetical protein